MNVLARSRLRSARQVALATLAIAAVVVPAAAAATAPPSDSLSPRLAELASPPVRSLSPAKQARRLSLVANGPGSLLRQGARVLVDVRFESGAAAAVEGLRRAGARIVHVSRRYQVVTVAATPATLPRIGELARVRGVVEDLAPISRATCPSGSVVSEGDAQLGAANARAGFGVNGAGVTIGILSDSFDQDPGAATHASGDVASGDLPGQGSPCGLTTPVGILENLNSEESAADEGRGMAQIVHDLAPGAAIDFASAFNGEFSFADNIRRLRKAGANVIVDDVAYPDEPFFQDGPVAVAVNEVTAAGASYFTAAGNDNLIDESGRNIASWEAPAFRDEGSCPLGVPVYAAHCMDFNPGAGTDPTFGITVEPGQELFVDLQWAQPWEGVTTDLDAYLLQGGVKVAESEYPNTAPSIQKPIELIGWENPSETEPAVVELAINRCDETCGIARALAHPLLAGTSGGDTASPRLKVALLENGRGVSATDYPESSEGDTVGPTIFGHAGAKSAFTLGAVPFNSGAQPEPYSSRGPVTHYFGPVVGGEDPAPELSEPEVVSKPDAVASDCVVTTFFATPVVGGWRFCGTSAAAPHAAAIAALVRQANPGASAALVRSALSSTARPISGFGPNAVGAGLLDAFPAVNALALAPTVTITRAPQALSRNNRPTVEFVASRAVAFSCSLDGLAAQPCASPYIVPTALSDGKHGFSVTGTDLGGRVGNSGVASFTIDTRAPRTSIVKHPPKLLLTRHPRARAIFRFRSSEPASTFACKVDREPLKPCGRRLGLRLGSGRHTVRVRARDEAGNFDPTPAVFHFRVKRVG
jgi:hypothetical protein